MQSFRTQQFIKKSVLLTRYTQHSWMEATRRKSSSGILKQQNAENEKFLALFPDIVSSIINIEKVKDHPDVRNFFRKLLEYNSAGGKKTRGLMTVAAYQMLEKPENITEESLRLAQTLGWQVELLQTSMLIGDDIIDNALTRRGSACWYRLPDVGMRAVNDGTVFLSLIFENLKNTFGGTKYYPQMIHIFQEALFHTCIGQHLDYTTCRKINLFTEKTYNSIACNKTAYYTFKLPIYASLLLANKSINDIFKNEEDILTQMGIFTLMQNDYLDCYASDQAGKLGTDIEEGKCTWLAVQALQRCDAEQRAEFEANYGHADPTRVERIKRLYEKLELSRIYQEVEQANYDSIVSRINAIAPDSVVPPTVLRKLFHMVYQICDAEIKQALSGNSQNNAK